MIGILSKWKNKTREEFNLGDIEHAFISNRNSNTNMYMCYVQYTVLIYRVASKQELFKIEILDIDKCFWNIKEPIEHVICVCEKHTHVMENFLTTDAKNWVHKLEY